MLNPKFLIIASSLFFLFMIASMIVGKSYLVNKEDVIKDLPSKCYST